MSKNQNQQWAGSGYDVKGTSDSNLFFLSANGQRARLRLVSEPYRYMDTIPANRGTAAKPVKRVAWVAILMEVVGNEQKTKVVVFQSTPDVYDQIRAIVAKGKEFADPTGYDIVVTRTGVQGHFYTVEVIKGTFKPLSPKAKKMVDDAAINLEEYITSTLNTTDATDGVATASGDDLTNANFDL